MKISVIIPAYNCSSTIDQTIQSVLAQSVPPHEILILDDGSKDDTYDRITAYEPLVKCFKNPNGGISRARNFLFGKAVGDIIAFLDNDDIWHPKYLEYQTALLLSHPNAGASITKYFGFRNEKDLDLGNAPEPRDQFVKLLSPLHFLRQYNQSSVHFLPSFCCVRKEVLEQLGNNPFPTELRGADDFYWMNILPLYGPVIFFDFAMGGYRLTLGSVSSNRLAIIQDALLANELLINRTTIASDPLLAKDFFFYSASLRRKCAKFLMASGRATEARNQIKISLKFPAGFISKAKSLLLYSTTLLPRILQPRWPEPVRN